MRAIVLSMALSMGCGFLANAALAAEPGMNDRCVEDDRAIEGWYVTDNRRGGSASYLILQKKLQRDHHFYLCRLDGEARHYVRELAIDVNPPASHLAAARCTPIESGVPGNEYFSVIDTASTRMLKVYRFDALEEDIESLAADSVVCSALPAT